MKHTVLPDGQSPTVAFIVLAKFRGPKGNKTEIGAALFPKMARKETPTLTFDAYTMGNIVLSTCAKIGSLKNYPVTAIPSDAFDTSLATYVWHADPLLSACS